MTEQDFQERLTPAQRKAFNDLVRDSGLRREDVLARSYPPTQLTPYMAVHDFHGMFVGIESDGYVHT